MRIGHYVSVVSGQKGFEQNVSGHIQVPLHAMKLLREAGHDVELVTNEFGPERTLPACMPEGVPVHYVVDARRRGGVLERTGAQGSGVTPRLLLKQAMQMKRIAAERRFEVFHFWGFHRTAHLAGGLRLLGLGCPTVAYLCAAYFPERFAALHRRLWRRIGAVVTATDHVRDRCLSAGIPARIIRHGIVRHIDEELPAGQTLAAKHRVLFWRDPSFENGADVTLKVYDALAPRYPDVSFDLAIRPHWHVIEGIDELEAAHDNVHVHRFPYGEDISLPKLLLESLCVLMPIRGMSLDPQLVIAESLACGIPVIATDQRSNPEFITPGRNGDLVPLGDVGATIDALDRILADREGALQMGRHAAEDLTRSWNWDRFVGESEAIYRQVTGV